jgi:N,N-dimethylformamidase beta subunit-like protein/uncharacterized protein DUF4082/concanavalin A-like lectin/glucanase superfamily protein/fibronectin type III domain protein/BACON domain-containing protein/Big-like domain-containing protein
MSPITRLSHLALAAVAAFLLLTGSAAAACTNAVSCENEKPGSPPSAWQITGNGDASIQGYATTMSVNRGETIRFKINTPASGYRIDIYRLGYYQGNGARLWASNIRPTATLPQNQPNCITQAATGLYDCGNWGVSASWAVPANAVSGIYIARLVRDDTGGASQIPFVVRDDGSGSDMLIKTSDATWHAYTLYGGNNLYRCGTLCPPGNPYGYKGAFAVSYNRPFDGTLPGDGGRSYLFYAEYQMLRFIERNGYDVSYISQPDIAADASKLLGHKLVISSGHDEYWSAPERTAFESARDAGVNLAFFSGNEVFWKTRWAPSIDGLNTPRRTLITYKDTHFTGPTDPVDWTGTWRDPRFARPGQAPTPENSLTGQFFVTNAGTSDITVPGQYRNLRLWRNTAVANLAANGSVTLAPGGSTLGYEWDIDVDNGFRPHGTFRVSSTTVSGLETFHDYGTGVRFGTTATHNMTMYRAPSGARVFGAGTVQWAWGLDVTNAWNVGAGPTAAQPDRNMQQMTVNLFADMGLQPDTLMSTLTPASPSTDTTAPHTTITSPVADSTINDGTSFTVTGTATDTGGAVAGIEISTDGGGSWHPATGTNSWSYSWIAHGAPRANVLARAVDDSGNIEASPASVTVDIRCPCTLAGSAVTPWAVDSGDTNSLEVGVRFKSDLNGTISGIRFYKASANTGTHIGNLWRADGTLLARGTFSGETATGWQQLNFATPVEIEAGATYVASYFAPNGHYSVSEYYYYKPAPQGGNQLDSAPLHVLPANGGAGNGVFAYTTSTTFPALDGDGSNYAVDVLFTPSLPPGPPSNVTATAGPGSATVSFTAPGAGGTPSRYIVTPFIGSVAQPAVTVTGSPPATSVYVGGLDPASTYTFRVQAANANGTSPSSGASNAVTPFAPTAPGVATGVQALQGNGKVTVRWTAPSDGGRTITSYTVTPYVAGAPLAPTTVTGSPAPSSAVVPNLDNGTSYTFTVKATNVVGTGAESAPSNAVTPSPAPEFIQQMSARSASAGNVQMTPTSNLTLGNRIVVVTGFWNWGSQAVASVSDSAGNTYTRVANVRAPDQTELAVWTAPVTAGGGTRPTISVTGEGVGGIGAAAVEYANLSTAAGAAAVDRFVTAGGNATSTGFVSSGATGAVTGDNALALGFYVDSGFSRSLLSDPAWTERVNVSPTTDMEFVVEELLPNRGDTPNARVSTVNGTPWAMATVVFKTGAPNPPTLAVSPASVSFNGTAGGSNPAAKTLDVSNSGGGSLSWTVSESAPWLSASPGSGTNAGTVTLTPSISGLAAGTYSTDVTVSAGAVAGSPKVVPVTFTVAPPSPPVLSTSPASLSFSATTGGSAPAAKTIAVSNTGGGTLSWTASESVSWLAVSPGSGTGDATVTVTPSITGLAAGTYTTDVTVAAPGVSGSPKTVAVTLTVTDPPACATPTGLVGAWGFDEASGTTVSDTSPTANSGSVVGALRSTTGRFGGALSFDGVNDRVTVPDVPALDLTTGMTLEAWVSPTAVNDWRTVMLKERAGNLVYSLYGSSDNGRPSAFVQTPLESDVRGTAALAVNTWAHLASTYDGTTLRLYVNGTQVASRAVSGSITASTGVLSIGGNGSWGEWFAGLIDEVRVYNRALSASEVAADMTTPVTCAGPPVLAVSPAGLSFSGTQGGAAPAAKTISVANTGGGTLSWTASESAAWLSLAPASGTNAGTITVTPSLTGLSAGTYTADVTITAGASSKTVPVTLTVDPPPPVITVAPTNLSFTGTANGADPAAKTFDVSNGGGGTLNWTVSESASWMSASPGSGTNAGTVTVTPSITGLAAGAYTADITVAAPGATSRTVQVTLTLDPPPTPPVLSTSPASLAFSATQGGASPVSKSITVTNTGGGTLNWTASEDAAWLSVSPGSGTGNGTVTVSATTGSLTAGTYTADVTVSATGVSGSPKTIPVTFTVDPPPPPALAVSPTSVSFTATMGGSAPAAQNVNVTNTGSGTLDWTAADDAAWLTVTPSGSAPGTVTLTPSITGLAAGTYTATVTVTAPGATGSPKTVAVTLTVNPSTPPNLIGAWGFDEATGATATDASGRAHAGTINGATRVSGGRYGGALSFDGVNDLVTVADTNALDLTNGMTLEAWIQPTAVGAAWRTVLIKEQPGNLIYALYAGDGAGRPASHIFTTADRGISGTTATPVGTWTHLAATYDGANLRLYVNGTQVATRAQTGNIRASTGALRIGGNNVWAEWFSGLIDEVRIYNRALTAAEIQTDMTAPVSGG